MKSYIPLLLAIMLLSCSEQPKEAVEKKGNVLWLRYGIENDQAEKIAKEANIKYLSNKCIKQEYQRLFLKSNPVFPVLKD